MDDVVHHLLHEAPAVRLASLLADRVVTAETVARWHLERIEAFDQRGPTLNAFISINARALDDARTLDLSEAPVGPLHGIPVVVKDNIDVEGLATTGGCAALSTLRPARDAPVVDRLRQAGAVILGKTNMSEFAWGIVDTVGSALPGFTRNPYDTAYASGGSSGGTAVAVAAGLAVAGLGTDTGCSVRAPAAINALVGLRPTHGLVSLDGVMPMNADWDTVGPLARTVMDVAILLDVIAKDEAGRPLTRAAADAGWSFAAEDLYARPIQPLRLAALTPLTRDGLDPEVKRVFEAALVVLRAAGVAVLETSPRERLPAIEAAPWYRRFRHDLNAYLAAQGERAPYANLTAILASGRVHPFYAAKLRDMDAIQEPPDGEPQASHRARERQGLRELMLDVMDRDDLDALLFPTFRQPPKRTGDRFTPHGSNNFVASLAGLPALNVPMGFTARGLPLGLQLLGRPWSERRLVEAGLVFEALTGHRRPPVL